MLSYKSVLKKVSCLIKSSGSKKGLGVVVRTLGDVRDIDARGPFRGFKNLEEFQKNLIASKGNSLSLRPFLRSLDNKYDVSIPLKLLEALENPYLLQRMPNLRALKKSLSPEEFKNSVNDVLEDKVRSIILNQDFRGSGNVVSTDISKFPLLSQYDDKPAYEEILRPIGVITKRQLKEDRIPRYSLYLNPFQIPNPHSLSNWNLLSFMQSLNSLRHDNSKYLPPWSWGSNTRYYFYNDENFNSQLYDWYKRKLIQQPDITVNTKKALGQIGTAYRYADHAPKRSAFSGISFQAHELSPDYQRSYFRYSLPQTLNQIINNNELKKNLNIFADNIDSFDDSVKATKKIIK